MGEGISSKVNPKPLAGWSPRVVSSYSHVWDIWDKTWHFKSAQAFSSTKTTVGATMNGDGYTSQQAHF